jgi:shikimate dehydrogenase
MHNAAFASVGINACYKLFSLKENELQGFMRSLRENRICGLNVTVPYKEKVIPYLDKLSEGAELIGAVNTIRVLDDRLVGFNTDSEGFYRHLSEGLQFNPQGKRIILLGAGGAAKAVCFSLAKARPGCLYIYDIDKTKTRDLLKRIKKNFQDIRVEFVESIGDLRIDTADLLINATPVGMKETDPCLINKDFLHKDLLVYDLVYNPPETKLLRAARRKGARTSNGLGMLLYQGVLSFEIWTGLKAPVEVMHRALESLLSANHTF